jgi:hypothetical protein
MALWGHAVSPSGESERLGAPLILSDSAPTAADGGARSLRTTASTRLVRERSLARALLTEMVSGRMRPRTLIVATRDGAGPLAVLDVVQHGVRLSGSTVILVAPAGGVVTETLADVIRRVSGARTVLVAAEPGAPAHRPDPGWGRAIGAVWAAAVEAGVPLSLLGMLLCMPLLALAVVVGRLAIGVHTFGTFGPIIIALALLTTGLAWGVFSFVVIVGAGVWMRHRLQRLALQAVARVAVLVTLVALMLSGLLVGGALLGVPDLSHVGVFPMLVMAHLIESVSSTQLELGLRRALATAAGTLGLAIVCYVTVDRLDLISAVLVRPELLLGATLLTVALGRWHGMRLVEYLRFWDAAAPGAADDTRPERLAS